MMIEDEKHTREDAVSNTLVQTEEAGVGEVGDDGGGHQHACTHELDVELGEDSHLWREVMGKRRQRIPE